MVSVTIPKSLPCHGIWTLTLWCGFWSQWPQQCRAVGQSWLSFFTSQMSCSFPQECISALLWHIHGHVPTHPGYSHWSFLVKPPSRDCLCSVYGKPIPSSSTSHGQFVHTPHLCLSMGSSLQRLCPCQNHPYFCLASQSLMRLDPQYSMSCLQLFHHQGQQWPWLDWKGSWQVFASHCSELSLASSTNLGIFLSPNVELWSLLALTSLESTLVLLRW